MNVITAPTYPVSYEKPAIFLGGAITGAPDWQSEAIQLLAPAFKTCFNPRRPDGFVGPGEPGYLESYREQVKWEHSHLRVAEVVLFWLPKEALAITTRFEIGWWYGLQEVSSSRADAEEEETKQPSHPFAVGIEQGVVGETYYRVVLPEMGIPVFSTLEATCKRAIELLALKDT